MVNLFVDEMIISCEACGNVKRYHVKSQDDCDEILKQFKCENNCGRNLLSYITVGSLNRNLKTADNQVDLAIAAH